MNHSLAPGVRLTREGVHFTLFSQYATSVDLLLFDHERSLAPSAVVGLDPSERALWHTLVPGIGAGQYYGYRVTGPWEPTVGHRFDSTRLLLDPYARAITGQFDAAALALTVAGSKNAPPFSVSPKAVVIDEAFDWGHDRRPAIPWTDTVLYETHMKGLTAHPSSKSGHPGTYLGVIDKIPYFKKLGVTSLEFLPIQHCQTELSVARRGLTNYWGYMTLGYFAPDRRYSTGHGFDAQVREFKEMVAALHKAGLEVILDVVYNHTCEGPVDGPTVCWRGIDNRTYYALADDPSRYRDTTGCGNSLDCGDPVVVQMIMDSMRYWVEVMHVDGFRLDLATTLGRQDRLFNPRAALLTAMYQDPVVSQVKLIAEPWDLGEGSYQVGNFPRAFSEWNGRYRDAIRKHLKGDWNTTQDFSIRQVGSPDLYAAPKRPTTSINFITAHDGFTLCDLVSYFEKHNLANGENNSDGESSNNSWNWGVEGETDDPTINTVRRRMMRNFMTCLLTAWGVPMLLGGDEFMRTQQGNNNPYAQDNDINWYDWNFTETQWGMVRFVQRLLELRRRFPQLRPATFTDRPQFHWLGPDGQPLELAKGDVRTLGLHLEGDKHADPADVQADLLIWFHTDWQAVDVTLPPGHWIRLLDTQFEPVPEAPDAPMTGTCTVTDRSLVLLVRPAV